MAELTKAKIETVAKLLVLQKDYIDKLNAVTLEIETILGGGASTGDLLKRLYLHYDTVWAVRYAHGETGKYIWTHPRDAAQMKRLVKMLGVEEIERRVIAYMRNDDPYFVKSRHSFGAFVVSINQHAAAAESPEKAAAESELDADVAATRRRQQGMR